MPVTVPAAPWTPGLARPRPGEAGSRAGRRGGGRRERMQAELGARGMERASATSRRTQKMRSAETRRKLVDATLDALMDVGYQNTSTSEIVRRAGVSRGALVHHFPSKADLVAAAAERMLERATDEIGELAVSLRSADMTIDDFVDHLWGEFSGRLFYVTLEYVTRARTDPELREALSPVVVKFHRALDEIWRRFFRGTRLTGAQVDIILNLTLCLLRGMGVQTVLRDDPRYYDELLSTWKALLSQIVEVQSDATRPGAPSGARPGASPVGLFGG